MIEPEEINEVHSEEGEADNSVWGVLTEEQKKNFKKITEKNEENLKYIG